MSLPDLNQKKVIKQESKEKIALQNNILLQKLK